MKELLELIGALEPALYTGCCDTETADDAKYRNALRLLVASVLAAHGLPTLYEDTE